MTLRIVPAFEKYLRSLNLSAEDRKILDDCLKAQDEYGQLTRNRWEIILKMARKPKLHE